jgi:hypothetical protein
MYGALLSVLFLQLFVVVAAPFAARVGCPLVMTVPSGVATTIYPGPVLIVTAMAAGFAVTLATPTTLVAMTVCYFCQVFICDPYPVASCGEVDFLYVKIICACNIS